MTRIISLYWVDKWRNLKENCFRDIKSDFDKKAAVMELIEEFDKFCESENEKINQKFDLHKK